MPDQIKRRFNVLPDIPDERDYIFKATRYAATELPSEVDLRPLLSPIVDQGSLGSCTANAIVSGFREHLLLKYGKPLVRLSRLFIYYKEREVEGTINTDAGAYIRDGMKILMDVGVPPETDFPYVESTFMNAPSDAAIKDAGAFRIREYHRITSSVDLLHALAEGNTVVLGMRLFDSFYHIGSDGIFTMPLDSESIIGGHAMLAVGYKMINGVRYIIVRNSWGTGFGDQGYCYIPEEYIRSINVQDMWTGRVMALAEDFAFKNALEEIVKRGIFDSPEFWNALYARYLAGTLTNEDFKYIALAFQKFAAYIVNNVPSAV